MSQKVIFLSLIIMTLIVAGMIRFAVVMQEEARPLRDLIPAEQEAQKEGLPPLSVDQSFTETFELPVTGSVPMTDLRHTIDLSEIRRGCFVQDCIPSVEDPQFVAAESLSEVLDPDSLGIVIAEANRFYPFPMLETHELVNETLPDGTPVLISYCPLCGTGIVFDRRIAGEPVEFGVSGMLWQSNLLMYNRAEELTEQNLWSQVLGQAVVGERAGEKLTVLPSDIITFKQWLETNPQGETLVTGDPENPYDGAYVDVALRFGPNFDATQEQLLPADTYVHGIVLYGVPKAYVTENLEDGLIDIVAGERIFVERTDTQIRFMQPNAENGEAPTELPDVEGFWFSWVAAHPDTQLWVGE